MEIFIETTYNVLIGHNLWICLKYKEQTGFSMGKPPDRVF